MIGLHRNENDKFYTSLETVNICYNEIVNTLNIEKTDLIIEPSAGNGAFINIIKKLSDNYIFCDILPEHNEIVKADFLKINIKNDNKQIHIIGNPPFGRQSSLAKKFIKHCCNFATTISFILPKSFKKESFKKSFDEYFHLASEINLPDNSFQVNNNYHNVPCIFQIWKKENYKRELIIYNEPINYYFTNKDNNPDISFRRVGVNAGYIDKNIIEKSSQSHYFIKFSNDIFNDELYNKLQNIEFNFDNTVGPKSISKPELIEKFNEIILENQE